MPRAARGRAAHEGGFASDSSTEGHKKFFWTTSRNRVVGDPIAVRIARIARKPIRMQVVARDREEDRRAPNACRNVRDTTIAPTIRARRRRFEPAYGPSRRPRDAAEAFRGADRAAEAARCDIFSIESEDGASER